MRSENHDPKQLLTEEQARLLPDKAAERGSDVLSRVATGAAAIVIGVVVLLVLITLFTFMFWPDIP